MQPWSRVTVYVRTTPHGPVAFVRFARCGRRSPGGPIADRSGPAHPDPAADGEVRRTHTGAAPPWMLRRKTC